MYNILITYFGLLLQGCIKFHNFLKSKTYCPSMQLFSRSSCPEVLCKKGVLRNSQESTYARVSFFNFTEHLRTTASDSHRSEMTSNFRVKFLTL